MMAALIKSLNRFGARVCGVYSKTFLDEMLFQGIRHRLLVVNNQNAHILVFHSYLPNPSASLNSPTICLSPHSRS